MTSPASEPLLSIRDLSVSFRTRSETVRAVDGVSFDVFGGETLGVVGESGSGKSVTMLSILRLLPHTARVVTSGQALFRGRDLIQASGRQLRSIRGREVALVPQDPMSCLDPVLRVGNQLREAIRAHHAVPRAEQRSRAIELLDTVGLPQPERRYSQFPHEYSGGMRQRAMIAMGIANGPSLLIADEPTTALDVTVQAQILTLLKEVQARMGMAMIFITHDLGIVRHMADRICVMTNGEIVETGPTAAIFAAPSHPYTKHLLAAEPRGEPPPPDADAPVLVKAEGMKVWFPVKRGFMRRTIGHIKAVDGIDLEIKRGQTLGVVGESGSGKTTLGRALLRLISAEGTITFEGAAIHGHTAKGLRPLRAHMQIVFQDPFGSLSPRMAVGDIVAEGLRVHFPGLSSAEREQKVARALEEVGLDPAIRLRYPHEFSGGQRQRISIARAMVLEPRFVVLDEPTSALDMSVQAQVVDLLAALQARHGLAYLFISHDLKVVRALANDLLVMRAGKIVEAGPAEAIFEAPREPYTKALMAAAFEGAPAATAPTERPT